MIPLIVIILCLLLNAVFSCAEMAFVSVNKRNLHFKAEEGNKRAELVEGMHRTPERILSVVQVGITLVAAISAAVSGSFAEEYLNPWLKDNFHISEQLSESLAIVAVVIPITFFTVLIGELVPKSIAIKYSLRISLLLAPGLKLADKTLGFLVTPLERMTNFLVEIIFHPRKLRKETETESAVSIKGLRKEHQEYVHNIIDLGFRKVKRALVHWDQVTWIDARSRGQIVYDTYLRSGFTRLVVVKNKEVFGFLHLKEFLQVLHEKKEDDWLQFVRPPVFISPDLKLINALKIMKENRVQILIVGSADSPLGIVTLEDVIEEVVGDIVDETEDKQIVGFLRHMVMRK